MFRNIKIKPIFEEQTTTKMKKLIIILVIALLGVSCTKSIDNFAEPKPANKKVQEQVKRLQGFSPVSQ